MNALKEVALQGCSANLKEYSDRTKAPDLMATFFTQLGLDAYLAAASTKLGLPMGDTKQAECVKPQTVVLTNVSAAENEPKTISLTGDVKWLAPYLSMCDGTYVHDQLATFASDDPEFVKEAVVGMTSAFGYQLTVDASMNALLPSTSTSA